MVRSVVPLTAPVVLALTLGCDRDDPAIAKAVTVDGATTATPSTSPEVESSASAAAKAAAQEKPELAVRGASVHLDGTFHPGSSEPPRDGPRIYAKDLRAWIREKPSKSSRRVGYLRVGASSPTARRPVSTEGCPKGWFPVEPFGYLCLDERNTTLDGADPAVRIGAAHPPRFEDKLPYVYGTVRRPGPVYQRLPSPEQVERAEKGHRARMKEWLELEGESGAGYAQHVWAREGPVDPTPADAWERGHSDPVPWFLESGRSVPNLLRARDWDRDAVVRRQMASRVGHSILTTFFANGRRYAVGSDFLLLPTDRLRPIQGSSHHGFRVGVDVKLPFAIVRKTYARFTVVKNGKVRRGAKAPYFSAVSLTGQRQFFDIRIGRHPQRVLHYETADGRWIADRYASLVRSAKRMPKWGKNGERWLDVALARQLLLAYEGEKLVYATLISSGEAGLEDPEHTTATKRGIFRIHTKHVTATMSSDEIGEAFELRDVPYVQYFDKAGYALHGAYWHDRFGTPKSHGCINLTPEDARRLFFWTGPEVPPGWHGRLLPLRGTVVFIHP